MYLLRAQNVNSTSVLRWYALSAFSRYAQNNEWFSRNQINTNEKFNFASTSRNTIEFFVIFSNKKKIHLTLFASNALGKFSEKKMSLLHLCLSHFLCYYCATHDGEKNTKWKIENTQIWIGQSSIALDRMSIFNSKIKIKITNFYTPLSTRLSYIVVVFFLYFFSSCD